MEPDSPEGKSSVLAGVAVSAAKLAFVFFLAYASVALIALIVHT